MNKYTHKHAHTRRKKHTHTHTLDVQVSEPELPDDLVMMTRMARKYTG